MTHLTISFLSFLPLRLITYHMQRGESGQPIADFRRNHQDYNRLQPKS